MLTVRTMVSPRLTTSASLSCGLAGLAFLVTLYVSLAAMLGDRGGVASGWYVPDGITLFGSAIDDQHLSPGEIFDAYRAGAALAVLNSWLVAIGPIAASIFNWLALSGAIALLVKGRFHWMAIFIACTPYYLIATTLPSKDILVLLLFSIAVRVYLGSSSFRVPFSLLVAVLLFFVRDGFSAILASAILAAAVVERLHIRPLTVVLAAIAVSATFWIFFESILENSFLYVRAAAIAEQGTALEADSVPTVYGYFVRLLGNATNLAFRPILFDTEGRLSLLSFCYWASGLTLLYALACCARGLFSPNAIDQRCGTIGIICLVLVSVTPYVQPRYLLPLCLLVPTFSFVSPKALAKGLAVCAACSLVAAAAYVQSGNYPPPVEPIYFSVTEGR
jgi:hypothetical protein